MLVREGFCLRWRHYSVAGKPIHGLINTTGKLNHTGLPTLPAGPAVATVAHTGC